MNAKTAKKIRRALREEFKKGSSPRWVAHAERFTNVLEQPMVRYKMQYVVVGARQLYKLAKKIYRLSGVLPQVQ